MADEKNVPQSIEWKINFDEGMELKSLVLEGFYKRILKRIVAAFDRSKYFVVWLCKRIWELGADDPRRVIHSIKVGLALSLVSLFYFMKPLFDSVGGTAVWAIMTVVVVFEFTVGATLSKGLNRSCATLVAGSLGVGVSYLAEHAGANGERVILAASVFVVGAASTFSRFFPNIKRRYDYGVVIFILTFNLIAISGYRVENLFQMAHQRLATIIIGCALCFLISLLICPIWAGDDLHSLIIRNLRGLAGSLEGCIKEYFKFVDSDDEDSDRISDDQVLKGYKCVLNSKTTEESLANFASWEPPHGQFVFRYPWKQYVKIGAMMRYCAYCVEALNGCLNSEIQAPKSLRRNFKTPCMNIGIESSKVLHELAESIRTMTKSSNADVMMDGLRTAVEDLQNSLRTQPELFIDTKRWQIVDEKSLRSSEAMKAKSKSERFDHKMKPAEQEEINSQSFRSTISWPMDIAGDHMAGDEALIGRYQSRELKQSGFAFVEALPLATFASLLTEIVARLESVVMEVHELGDKANFREIMEDKNLPIIPTITPSASSQTNPAPTKPPPSQALSSIQAIPSAEASSPPAISTPMLTPSMAAMPVAKTEENNAECEDYDERNKK